MHDFITKNIEKLQLWFEEMPVDDIYSALEGFTQEEIQRLLDSLSI